MARHGESHGGSGWWRILFPSYFFLLLLHYMRRRSEASDRERFFGLDSSEEGVFLIEAGMRLSEAMESS